MDLEIFCSVWMRSREVTQGKFQGEGGLEENYKSWCEFDIFRWMRRNRTNMDIFVVCLTLFILKLGQVKLE